MSAFSASSIQPSDHSSLLPLPKLVPIDETTNSQNLIAEWQNMSGEALIEKPQSSGSIDVAGQVATLLSGVEMGHIVIRDNFSSPDKSTMSKSSLRKAVEQVLPNAFDCTNTVKRKGVLVTSGQSTTNEAIGIHSSIPISHDVQDPNSLPQVDVPKPILKKKRTSYQQGRRVSEKQPGGIAENFWRLVQSKIEEFEFDEQNPLFWQDVFSVEDLQRLNLDFLTLKKIDVLQRDANYLLKLLPILDASVKVMMGTNGHPRDVKDDVFALEGIHCELIVMSSARMPNQIYNEEAIERILMFLKKVLYERVFPTFDSSCQFAEKVDMKGEDQPGSSSAAKKRGRKSEYGNHGLQGLDHYLFDKLCAVFSLLVELLGRIRLQDTLILQLAKIAVDSFSVSNIELLQLQCLELLSDIFKLYPSHRISIMDDVISLLWKFPGTKRNLRTYHLADNKKQIQMLTAVIMSLIQSTVELPVIEEASIEQPLTKKKKKALLDSPRDELLSGFEQAKGVTTHFWKSVLNTWGSSKTHEGVDTKSILENLILDLMDCLDHPEMPSASFILQIFCILLMKSSGLGSPEYIIRGNAVDLLGQVALKLKKDAMFYSCLSQDDGYWVFSYSFSKDVDETQLNQKNCSDCCQKIEQDLVYCSECKRSFHLSCGNLETVISKTTNPLCICCYSRTQLESFQEMKLKEKSDLVVQKNDLLQQILLNYFSLQENHSASFTTTAWRFLLSWWFYDEPRSECNTQIFSQRIKGFPFSQESSSHVIMQPKRDCVLKIYRSLLLQRPLARGLDKIVEAILFLLQDPTSAPRAKALKAVSNMVEVDPSMLEDERIKDAVEGRFLDSAISVREAAVDLVGKHILKSNSMALKYYERVAERSRDTGLSVRKKVVKILKDIVLLLPGFPKATEACKKIMERINDDEPNVKEMVIKAAQEIWFEEREQTTNSSNFEALKISNQAEQFVAVLKGSSVQLPHMVTIIKKSLLDKNLQKSSLVHQRSNLRQRCEAMCKHMLEGLLKAFEENSEDSEVKALSYLMALQAFSMADPSLCVPGHDSSKFAVALHPYLKSQPGQPQNAPFLQSTIFVLDSVLPLLKRPSPDFLEDLERDLRSHVLSNRYLSVVQASIKCLCSLSKIHEKTKLCVSSLVRYYHKKLVEMENNSDEKSYSVIERNLFVLGNLAQNFMEELETRSIQDVSVESTIEVFLHHFKNKVAGIKSRALQGLGFLLVAKPQLMLNPKVKEIIEATLSSGADLSLKKQTLVNFLDYLHNVEEILAESSEKSQVVNLPEVPGVALPVAAGAGDVNNSCGGIVQLYWEKFLECALDENEGVRFSTLKIMEVVLRQGLVHPVTSVPTLVALEVDFSESNSKLAHKMVVFLYEKYPQFLESKLGDGLQVSFKFVNSIVFEKTKMENPKGKDSEYKTCREGISRVYRLIRGSRTSRNKFMGSIVRKFDPSGQVDLKFLRFCAEILSSLPFSVPDEPLYLIFCLNRAIHLRCGGIISTLKSTLSGKGPFAKEVKAILAAMDLEEKKKGEDSYSLVITQDSQENQGDNTSKSTGEVAISSEKFKALQRDCEYGMAMSIVLSLKRHLKLTYSLSDARCQAFDPTEAMAKNEPLSRKDEREFNCCNLTFETPQTLRDVLLQYISFKQLLHDDSVLDCGGFSLNKRRTSAPPPTKVLEKDSVAREPIAASRKRRRASDVGLAKVKGNNGGGGTQNTDENDEDYVVEGAHINSNTKQKAKHKKK